MQELVFPQDRTFVHRVLASKNGEEIDITCTPYVTGMLVVMNGQKDSVTHKSFPEGIQKVLDRLRKDGWEIATLNMKYTDFLPLHDLVYYDILP